MKTKSLGLILFIFSNQIMADDCFQTTTRIIFDRKTELEANTLCKKKTADKLVFYVSKSCDNDQCEILKRPKKNLPIKNYLRNLGSPGFKLCEELEGLPQIFEFQDQSKKWQSTERCFFGKEDFVEISLLTYEWKAFILSPKNH